MYLVYQTAKIKIEKYFSDLKFYDNIESFSPYKYNINGDYDNETKNDYNYYYKQEKLKEKIGKIKQREVNINAQLNVMEKCVV